MMLQAYTDLINGSSTGTELATARLVRWVHGGEYESSGTF